MKTTQKHIMILTALTLLAGTALVSNAQADIRVGAKLRLPAIQVQLGDGPGAFRDFDRWGRLPAMRHRDGRVQRIDRVDRQDRKVAGRLARYTGVPERVLVRLRSMGYRWNEIGRWLEVPRRAIRAAQGAHSWKMFLRHDQRVRRGGRDAHSQGGRYYRD